jgi:hypothetical protein
MEHNTDMRYMREKGGRENGSPTYHRFVLGRSEGVEN